MTMSFSLNDTLLGVKLPCDALVFGIQGTAYSEKVIF